MTSGPPTSALLLWLLPALPLVSGVLIAALRDRLRAVSIIAVALVVLTLAMALWAAAAMPAARWSIFIFSLAPTVAVREFGRIMVVLVPTIALPVVLYAAYGRDEPAPHRLLGLLIAFTGAMELLVIANDFLTLLVAWELVGACSWALIAHEWSSPSRPRSARDAFLTTRAADAGLYLAAAAAYHATGSLDFDGLSQTSGPALELVAAGVLLACAAKSAQVPFSPWLFSAMAGPSAASALLHSATMVAAGAYLLVRLQPLLAHVAWFGPTVIALGLVTALAGGLVALLQLDLKKALAGSTSAQYGLMFVAVGAGYPGPAALHLVTHAAFKSLLFLGAGIVLHAAATLDLRRLTLGRALPLTRVLFGVGAVALSAAPPLGAAYSKEEIAAAAARGPAGGWLIAGVIAAAFLSALYAFRLQRLVFADPPAGHRVGSAKRERENCGAQTVAMGFLAVLSAALGLFWVPAIANGFANLIAFPLLPLGGDEIALSLTSVALAFAVAAALARREALVHLGLGEPVQRFIAGWFGVPGLTRIGLVQPALLLARRLAVFDDRIVDAGIRLAVRVGEALSSVFNGVGERLLGAVVDGVAFVTMRLGALSSHADNTTFDQAVERIAHAVDRLGAEGRKLQTGLAHDYYAIAAVGLLLMIAATLTAVEWG